MYCTSILYYSRNIVVNIVILTTKCIFRHVIFRGFSIIQFLHWGYKYFFAMSLNGSPLITRSPGRCQPSPAIQVDNTVYLCNSHVISLLCFFLTSWAHYNNLHLFYAISSFAHKITGTLFVCRSAINLSISSCVMDRHNSSYLMQILGMNISI